MVYGVYSIKDELCGYNNLMLFDNDNVAIRSFGTGLKDPQSYFFHNPSDFSLWLLATYDNDTGVIQVINGGKKICDASQFKRGDLGVSE